MDENGQNGTWIILSCSASEKQGLRQDSEAATTNNDT